MKKTFVSRLSEALAFAALFALPQVPLVLAREVSSREGRTLIFLTSLGLAALIFKLWTEEGALRAKGEVLSVSLDLIKKARGFVLMSSLISDPKKKIDLYEKMKRRTYTFYRGDRVRINDTRHPNDGEEAGVDFPYSIPPRDKEQLYVLDFLPVPVEEGKLTLVKRNPTGKIETLNFFDECIAKARTEEENGSDKGL